MSSDSLTFREMVRMDVSGKSFALFGGFDCCGGGFDEGLLTRMVEAFLRAKQKVGKLARNAKRAPVPAVKMREAPEPLVSRESETPSPNSAMVEADAARQASEPGVHSPAAAALQALALQALALEEALAQQTASRSLPRLRQEALRSTSPWA